MTQAQLLSGFADLVEELGGQPEPLLQQVGFTPESVEDPAALIPLGALGALLEDTAALLDCPDFGMRLAERQSMRTAMQPLDRLFCNAPDIRAALQCGSDHMCAFNSGLIMELEDNPERGVSLLHFQFVDGLIMFPQLIEQLVLLSHESVVFLSAGFARPRSVCFSHINVAPPAVYARRFNAVVKFEKEYDGLLLNETDLRTPVANCNAERFAREARAIEKAFPTTRKEIDLKVRQSVFRLLVNSEHCSRARISQELGIQERTLNRRLSDVGVSFDRIRDEVRRDLAWRYLARADLSLTDIAGRLGYSELAVLSRSCRRWFGKPPRKMRQDILAVRKAYRLPHSPGQTYN